MKKNRKFTIYHGFAASLALHSTLGLPFVVHSLAAPPEEPSPLVFELQGLITENQTQEKLRQDKQGDEKPNETNAPGAKQALSTNADASDDPQKNVSTNEKAIATPRSKVATNSSAATKSNSAGSDNVSGAEQQQRAQTIKQHQEPQSDPLKAYVKLLGKKVQARLVYPDEGRKSAATVSFVILQSGQIRRETLKIVASSGQPALDASALKTVRSSVPFDPPPKEMTVSIVVDFGRKR